MNLAQSCIEQDHPTLVGAIGVALWLLVAAGFAFLAFSRSK